MTVGDMPENTGREIEDILRDINARRDEILTGKGREPDAGRENRVLRSIRFPPDIKAEVERVGEETYRNFSRAAIYLIQKGIEAERSHKQTGGEERRQ